MVGAYAEALMRASRDRESLALASEAVDIARAVGARAQEGKALATMGVALAQLDDDVAGVAHLRDALAIAEEVGRPDDIGHAYLGLSELLAGPLNRVEEAVAVALQGAARGAAGSGSSRTCGVSLQSVAANGLFRLGRWAEADELVGRLLDRNPSGAVAIELYLARPGWPWDADVSRRPTPPSRPRRPCASGRSTPATPRRCTRSRRAGAVGGTPGRSPAGGGRRSRRPGQHR